MLVYLDHSAISAMVRRHQQPAQTAALDWLFDKAEQHNLQFTTSRESAREIGRTLDAEQLDALKVVYLKIKELKDDHVVLSVGGHGDRWTRVWMPFVSDVVDQSVFDKLGQIGLKGSDQKHLMYAIHNKCDVFLTLDRRDFIERSRRTKIEAAYPSIKVRTPAELRSGIDN